MNTINVTVINPGFMLAFFGTGVVCLAAVASSALRWSAASGTLVLIAAVIYVVRLHRRHDAAQRSAQQRAGRRAAGHAGSCRRVGALSR